eukprot:29717-Eustigmatos_ZCMA.PRE.1
MSALPMATAEQQHGLLQPSIVMVVPIRMGTMSTMVMRTRAQRMSAPSASSQWPRTTETQLVCWSVATPITIIASIYGQ